MPLLKNNPFNFFHNFLSPSRWISKLLTMVYKAPHDRSSHSLRFHFTGPALLPVNVFCQTTPFPYWLRHPVHLFRQFWSVLGPQPLALSSPCPNCPCGCNHPFSAVKQVEFISSSSSAYNLVKTLCFQYSPYIVLYFCLGIYLVQWTVNSWRVGTMEFLSLPSVLTKHFVCSLHSLLSTLNCS